MPAKYAKDTNGRKNIASMLLFFACFAYLAGNLTSCSKAEDKPASNMSAAREAKKELKELRESIKKVAPFFEGMRTPVANDWLASHKEPGQTFEEYIDSDPTKPTKERQKIYVLPLGTFNAQQTKIVDATAGYLEAFFDLEVVELPPRQLTVTSPNMRQDRLSKFRQIKTGHILNDILKPMLPADAAALIAFTTDDLYPDESMSYVFGQASLENRVGVWSLARLDDNADYDKFLKRTLKIAAHETGHMFSMMHCTKYECLMSGTNHLGETDRRPIDACPECMAKISWLSDVEPAIRYKNLAKYSKTIGLNAETIEFDRKAAAVIR